MNKALGVCKSSLGNGKLWTLGQIRLVIFMAQELRIVFTFSHGYIVIGYVSNYIIFSILPLGL